MKKFVDRFSRAKARKSVPAATWHNGGDIEIDLYTRSLQRAASTVVAKLAVDEKMRNDWDVGPIVLLYRQALELRLKAVVGEGSNFLKSPTDPISLYQTHSLRWLAQIVSQIIKRVGWETDFICEGVPDLKEFSALVSKIESLDPVTRAVHAGTRDRRGLHLRETFDFVQFAKQMDGLLDLLNATTDALAATWDQQMETVNEIGAKPTIH
jgi:hypothetical protein